MSTDAQVKQRKYPDEVWVLALDWTPALDGDTLVGTPTVTATGLVIDQIQQDGNVTKVKVSGGGPGYDLSARLQFLAPISTGEKLGFNLGVPTRSR